MAISGISRSPRTTAALAVLAVGWMACEDTEVFTVQTGDAFEHTFEGSYWGSWLPGIIGWDEQINLSQSDELRARNVREGDITDVTLTRFEIALTTPEDSDLSFLTELLVYVDAPGLNRVLIARGDEFPEGLPVIELELTDADITEFALREDSFLDLEVSGSYPEFDHDVRAAFDIDVGVTAQGACAAF